MRLQRRHEPIISIFSKVYNTHTLYLGTAVLGNRVGLMEEVDFKETLAYGNKIERLFVASYCPHTLHTFSETSDYDVSAFINGNHVTFEVKAQEDAIRNFAIEVRSNGVLSGISVTKADYFVIYHNETFYIWNMETFKDMLRIMAQEGRCLKTMGGYKNLSEIWCYDKNVLIENADEVVPAKLQDGFDFTKAKEKLLPKMPRLQDKLLVD